ncbi:MFS transporter [Bacillus sp. M6-12]|uniref:MFS transporter n=1 Tax=Bacillus sp. M6-12 TaxID=2054166 RepID=UPI000C76FF6D|nr:MFS transporter [Bacillus sp. M6-12]PLS17355.1 MFS transporter [Bacillus sp. M6-12]
MNKNLALFGNKNFIYFFFAALLGVMGEGIYGLTAIVLVLENTDSIVEIGKMLVLTLLPSVVLTPFLGVYIDKFNKVKIAVTCNILRFLSIAIIPGSFYLGFFHVSIFYISIFLSYLFWFVLEPVKESILKEVLNREQYKQGISLVQGAWQLGLFSSALIAGLLIDELSTNVAILVSSSVYIVAAFFFITINERSIEEKRHTKSSFIQYRADLMEGWIYIYENKKVMYFALTTSMVLPFFYAINTLIAPFNYQVLNGDGISLGIIDSGAGIGSLISAVICTVITKSKNVLRLILASIFLTAFSTFLFSQTVSTVVAFVMYLMIGLFIGNVKVLTRLLVFENVEERFIGRVMTSITFVSLALSIFMSVFIAFIAEQNLNYGYLFISSALLIPLVFSLMGAKAEANQLENDTMSPLSSVPSDCR